MTNLNPAYHRSRFLTGPIASFAEIIRDWGDVPVEEEKDRYFDLWAEYEASGKDESAAYARWKYEQLEQEVARRISIRDEHASDPGVPVWSEAKAKDYEELRSMVDFLKQAWPVEKFMGELMGIHLTPVGTNRMKGCCPFHPDQNPSLTAYTDQGTFYCFACDTFGDVLDCVGRYFHLDSFRDQVAKLAEVTPGAPKNDSSRSRPPRGSGRKEQSRRRSGVRLIGGKVVAA